MLIRRLTMLLVLAVVTLCYSQSSAEITLKKNFFTGWKYSSDGLAFKNVGFSGSELRDEMRGDEKAQAHMTKYKSSKTWAAITGWPGGFLLGWPIGGYLGSGGEWKDSYTTMMIIGAPLAVISTIFEASATRNLKKAVALHNGEEHSLGFMLDIRPTEYTQQMTPILGLKYEF